MVPQEIDTGYRPRPLQTQIHRELKRFNVLVCHRRFGKTVLCVNELIHGALNCRLDRPRLAYVAPYYRQAKQIAWDYLKLYARPIPGTSFHEGELRADLPNGSRIQLFGADNPDALRGLYFDGVVFDEYAHMASSVWPQVVRPALSDRGGWAIFIGTPKGRNSFHALYEQARTSKGWYAALFRASETGLLDDAECAAARRDMSEEEYAQEFECSFDAAIVGAYYARLLADAERDSRVCRVPWDPAVPVHTAWDLGIGDSTAIWFLQFAGREVHWIDYYEASGVGLHHYAKYLKEKPYVYGDHLVPHDARARELGTGRTRLETMARLGIKARIVPLHSVEDGINAVRNLIPRSWFDRDACRDGLETLRHYRRAWNEKDGVFHPRPVHDWASHGADAARIAAMGMRGENSRRPQADTAQNGYSIFRY